MDRLNLSPAVDVHRDGGDDVQLVEGVNRDAERVRYLRYWRQVEGVG